MMRTCQSEESKELFVEPSWIRGRRTGQEKEAVEARCERQAVIQLSILISSKGWHTGGGFFVFSAVTMVESSIDQMLRSAERHFQDGRWAEAEALYLGILAQSDGNAEALHNLGAVELRTGRYELAARHLTMAAAAQPLRPHIYVNLGLAVRQSGRRIEAISCLRRALVVDPQHLNGLNSYGTTLVAEGKFSESLVWFRRTHQLRPNNVEVLQNLAAVLQQLDECDEALILLKKAESLAPGEAETRRRLGAVAREIGDLEQSVTHYRGALESQPARADIHSELILTLTYLHGAGPILAAEQQSWNDRHAKPLKSHIRTHPNSRIVGRRLKIGYVSCDLKAHVVGRNVLPIFEHHDHEAFEIFAYSHGEDPDGLTARIRSHCDQWRETQRLDAEQHADLVCQDGIDILVDLGLHTANNRLKVFARKPAPVQASFAGYPADTGVEAIDYHLTDPYLEPFPRNVLGATERAVRLPNSFWCYDPVEAVAPVAVLPMLRNGFITFGCLNAFLKTNGSVIQLWSRVLQKVKNSRLLLLAPDGAARQSVRAQLGDAGGRIEFIDRLPRSDYLSQYDRIDIGLDTFPYNGHTTSLDSFWKGVPVITLVGPCSVARAGWSQLSNLGLSELAAHSADEFVNIASTLAADQKRLSELRSTLRNRMQSSPLMDAVSFTRGIESAFRMMWERWCLRNSTVVS